MTKLIHHTEIEYDFTVEYWRTEPPDSGGKIQPGTIDDNGNPIQFTGVAIVVAVQADAVSRRGGSLPVQKTTAYIKLFPHIDF